MSDWSDEVRCSFVQVGNIRASLACLSALGVSVDGVQARDVREGSLKAVLSLLFALSRYKQQQKQQQQRPPQDMPRLDTYFTFTYNHNIIYITIFKQVSLITTASQMQSMAPFSIK